MDIWSFFTDHKKRINKEMTTNSTISSSAMEWIVDRLKSQCRRDSTRSNYLTIWHMFNKFILNLDRVPPTWDKRLVLFVGYLIEKGRKSTTIKSYISAIKAILMDDNKKLYEDRFLLSALVKACKLKKDKVKIKFAIDKGVLALLLKALNGVYNTQPYLCMLYKAMFATAYFGLFRVGEITSGTHPIRAVDVHIAHNKDKLMFILRTSKTHGEYINPQVIKIQESKNYNHTNRTSQYGQNQPNVCVRPYQLLKNYLLIRRSQESRDEPFFIFRDRSPVWPGHMCNTLKKVLQAAKLHDNAYTNIR